MLQLGIYIEIMKVSNLNINNGSFLRLCYK
jgi:hypothetical protein